jgi:hypothetical protein
MSYTVRPNLGDYISVEHAEFLTAYYGIWYINKRLRDNPDRYKGFFFNGCSGVPDFIFQYFSKTGWKDITYECCLPHDLEYSYGDYGNNTERKESDTRFKQKLKEYLPRWSYLLMYFIVRIFGRFCFASKQ